MPFGLHEEGRAAHEHRSFANLGCRGKVSVQALLVWNAIRLCGIYGQPAFKDPVTDRVVSQMGWKCICATPESERIWFLRNFTSAYKAHRKCDEVKLISGPTAVGGLIQGMVKTIGMNNPPALRS